MARMNVNMERCKGCGLCTSVCPVDIVKLQYETLNSKGYYTSSCIDDDKCISCARCATMCPDDAITIKVEPKKAQAKVMKQTVSK